MAEKETKIIESIMLSDGTILNRLELGGTGGRWTHTVRPIYRIKNGFYSGWFCAVGLRNKKEYFNPMYVKSVYFTTKEEHENSLKQRQNYEREWNKQ